MISPMAAREAVLRIGEVTAVDGRKVFVQVDKKKNLSHMFLNGDVITNISVGGYVEIRKGFASIIGRVEGEKIDPVPERGGKDGREQTHRIRRILTVSLTGYIDEGGAFKGGTRELPLVGNEAFLLTKEQVRRVHDLVRGDDLSVSIADLYIDDLEVRFPVDGLFNGHIAIVGNTGSGKSNTLAFLFQELFTALRARNEEAFVEKTRFLVFDFNGEYSADECLTRDKLVLNLSTRRADADRIQIEEEALLDVEVISILSDATDKTQKPFLRRALRLLKNIRTADDPDTYLKAILRRRVLDLLQMSDKVRAFLLLDYFRQVVDVVGLEDTEHDVAFDLEWHNTSNEFRYRPTATFLAQNPGRIEDTELFRRSQNIALPDSVLSAVVMALYVQLINDILANRAQNEHIAPVINRLNGKKNDIEKLFRFERTGRFWSLNIVVVNLNEVNLDMKKTIPLLLSKRLYAEHKMEAGKTLTIIIDEAHNILSTQSFRETESWKDYRLETFEEIIKEGRKFGVFVTIASQRPNDISTTIMSQAHNYFIHRLINQKDLNMIASAVSYIDRLTEESIPTLPTGTCIFSGVASPMPLKIVVKPLAGQARPESGTREFGSVVPRRTS